jgi:hypothetical protein
VQRFRQMAMTERTFSAFTCPYLPSSVADTRAKLHDASKPTQTLHQTYQLEEMKENLPSSAGYLIVQLSDDEQYMFCGFMMVSKAREIKYHLTKLHLGNENRAKLLGLVKNLAQSKMTMQKAPITIEEDLVQLEKDSNADIANLLEKLEAFFDPVTEMLDSLINPAADADEPSADDATKGKAAEKGGKKEEKAAKAPPKGKGGGADAALAAYESTLPLPASGLESVMLFIDDRIESLPLEALKVFTNVPVVARDFNMHMYLTRLKWLGHDAGLHNNRGIAKEDLAYIIDPPSTLNDKAKEVCKANMPQMMLNSVWNGTFVPAEHEPSPGEWQEKISSSSLFAYYSMTCLLHKFPPHMIADLSIFSQCRAMVIFDRMNSYKTLVDRTVITSRHFIPSE